MGTTKQTILLTVREIKPNQSGSRELFFMLMTAFPGRTRSNVGSSALAKFGIAQIVYSHFLIDKYATIMVKDRRKWPEAAIRDKPKWFRRTVCAAYLPQANGVGDVILHRTVGTRVAKSARDSRGTALCRNSLSHLPTGDRACGKGA